jgi:hypothetical protein
LSSFTRAMSEIKRGFFDSVQINIKHDSGLCCNILAMG